MKPASKPDWKPLSRTQFDEILSKQVAELPPDALKVYETYAIRPIECPCHRSDQYGKERMFAVARDGQHLVVFDDVDDEFAVGEPDEDGVLRNWELYGDLIDAIRSFPNEVI